MLTKPKITILSLLIIAMLSVVPLIAATDDYFFSDSGDDEYDYLFPEGPLDEMTYEYDPYYYTYDDSLDLQMEYPEDDSLYDEDMFVYDPYEDPLFFDDPFDLPGDDIPDIVPDDAVPVQKLPEEPDVPTIKEDGYSIKITGTRLPSKINAGDQLMFKIYIKNTGKSIDNMKITLVNQELALRDSIGPFDLGSGDRASRTMILDFPYEITPGYYYLRINVHANGIDRIVYRDVYVA